MASCVCGEHDFYVKITPRRNSDDAVACASVAPVRLHRLIRQKGINTRRIIAHGGGSGGGGGLITLLFSAGLAQLSQDTTILGFFLEAREDPQKNYFRRRQQDHKSGCGEKINK
jgi:hypothetical protein